MSNSEQLKLKLLQISGTGNPWRDLISSSVPLQRISLSPHLPKEGQCPVTFAKPCSICGGKGCRPLTSNQAQILGELVYSRELVSGCEYICPGCSRTLEELVQLKTRVELVTHCLRALIRIQHCKKSTDSGQESKDNGFSTRPAMELELTDGDESEGSTPAKRSRNGSSKGDNQNSVMELELTDSEDELEHEVNDSETQSQNRSDTESRLIEAPSTKVSCSVCCLDYVSEYSLNRHRHSGLHRQGIKCRKVGPNGEATFCCDSCPQEFPILGEMLSHQKSLHKGQSTRVLDQEQESFNVKLDLENEADPPPVDDEMKPIVCDMEFELMEVDGQEEEIIMDQKVNEVFSVNQINQMTNAQLKKYCSIKDNGNIVCHLCNTSLKAYGQIGRFRRHLRNRTHTEPQDLGAAKKFRCEPCNRDFAQSSTFKEHLLGRPHAAKLGADAIAQRELNKTFKCHGCHVTFVSRKAMRQHSRVHGGPFICHNCGKQLTNPDSLRTHVSAVHSKKSKHISKPRNPRPLSSTSENNEVIIEEFRTKRKSAARAEQLLISMLKESTNENDEDESGSNASFDEDDTESDSNYDSDTGSETSLDKQSDTSTRVPPDPLECAICGHKALDSEDLHLHQAQHSLNECNVCVVTLKSELHFIRHLSSRVHKIGIKTRRWESELVTFSCDRCDVAFTSATLMNKHMNRTHLKTESNVHCDLCDRSFCDASTLKEHLLSRQHAAKLGGDAVAELEKKRNIKCDRCQLTFVSKKAMRKHRLGHDATKKFRCEPCNRDFTQQGSFKEHLLGRSHAANLGDEALAEWESKKNFKCDGCDLTFVSRKMMRKHRLNHIRSLTCDQCGKVLATPSSFSYHVTHVHSGKPKKIPKRPNRFVAPKDKRYSCKICNKRFQHNSGLYWHTKSIHQGTRYNCDKCPKELTSKTGLRTHTKMVHGDVAPKPGKQAAAKVSCDICSGSFFNKQGLLRHLELKHFPDKSRCPYGCASEFGNDQEWRLHLAECKSEKLSESAKCSCFFCGELFPTLLLRIAHHLRAHKSWPCEHCDRSFTQREFLTCHNNHEHKQVKPWLCTKCGKGFRQEQNLRFHSTTVCGDDEDAKRELLAKRRELHRIYRQKPKPHKCAKCSKTFVTERKLEDHKTKGHLNQSKSSDSGEDTDGVNETESD